ncbi:TPA: DUF1294 domain-containing protein [Streptococcus agalactiae]|nr:DUF1294 domain-containing protein [Streptococcus agalactiae]
MIELLLALLLWNILVFATYAIDKRRAIRGAWRISEKTLLIESLLLGGFGAFLSQIQCFYRFTMSRVLLLVCFALKWLWIYMIY